MTTRWAKWAEARGDSERGAALIEFALVAPVLMMLVLGLVQFGLVLNRQQGLHAAAREGARSASLPETSQDDIEQDVLAALDGVALAAPVAVTVSPDQTFPCDQRRGQPVTVEVQTTSVLDVPFVAGREIDIRGKGVFRCE